MGVPCSSNYTVSHTQVQVMKFLILHGTCQSCHYILIIQWTEFVTAAIYTWWFLLLRYEVPSYDISSIFCYVISFLLRYSPIFRLPITLGSCVKFDKNNRVHRLCLCLSVLEHKGVQLNRNNAFRKTWAQKTLQWLHPSKLLCFFVSPVSLACSCSVLK